MMVTNRLIPITNAVRGVIIILAAASCAGCSLTGDRRVERLESRLRQQESNSVTLQRQLQDAQADLAAAQREVESLRAGSVVSASAVAAEQIEPVTRMQKLELNSLLTGGLNRDQLPGDELFTLLVAPKDAAGNVIRVPGSLLIELIDFGAPEDEQRIGVWKFDRAEAAELWRQGWVGVGYQLESPWQKPPRSSEIHAHVRLVTSDGRQFDTTGKLRVTPPTERRTAARKVESVPAENTSTNAPATRWKNSHQAQSTAPAVSNLLPD